MQDYKHYPIINQVESVLISTKPAIKTFGTNNSLIQSLHTTDSNEHLFSQPSKKCLKQIIKINPIQVHSLQINPNSNIKAFIYISLDNSIDGDDENFYQYFLEQIQNTKINISIVTDHPHQNGHAQMMITAIIGFLKSLKIKKIKNKQIIWQNQLENTPIIMDYLVIFCRAILSFFGLQNAQNYSKQLSTRSVIQKLSQYFDLNYIEKQKYFLFEQSQHFIYEYQKQIVFGKFCKQQQSNKNQENPQAFKISTKYNNYNLKILQNSTQSLMSSKHQEDQTPFFNVVTQEQARFNYNKNEKIDLVQELPGQNASSHLFKSNGTKWQPEINSLTNQGVDLQNSKPDSITSSVGFHINVFSEQKNLCQKTKYHKNTEKNDTFDQKAKQIKDKIQKQNQVKKICEKALQKQKNQKQKPSVKLQFKHPQVKPFNQITKTTKIPQKKNFFTAKKKYSQQDFTVKQYDKLKAFKKKSQNCNSQQTFKRVNTEQFDIKTRNFHKDCNNWPIVFDWQNDQRRLMRVQSVSYKTCGTCHRRFYRNQITSQVFEVAFKPSISKSKPSTQQANKSVQTTQTKTQIKEITKYFPQRFHKKSADAVILQNASKKNYQISNSKSLKWLQTLQRKRSPHSYHVVPPRPRISIQEKVSDQKNDTKNLKNGLALNKMNSKQNLLAFQNKPKLIQKKQGQRQKMVQIQKKSFQPYQVKKLDQILSFKSPKNLEKNNNVQMQNQNQMNMNQNHIRKSPDIKLLFGHLSTGGNEKRFQKFDNKKQGGC